MNASHLQQHVRQNPERLKGVQQERLIFDAALLIGEVMRMAGITRKCLADRLRVTKGMVTKYLCGERNLTLRTLADAFTVMGYSLVLDVEPIADDWQWGTTPAVTFVKQWKATKMLESSLDHSFDQHTAN